MLNRSTVKAATTVLAAAVLAAGLGTPLSASAATGGGAAGRGGTAASTGAPFRIFQKINGFKVCLDSQFEFSVCQTSPSPDDPPRVQKWTLLAAGNGAVQIDNQGQCLDLTQFTAPCTNGGSDQQWVRVSAGHGTVKVEHISADGNKCLDSMWTFKTCTRGDKQQIWTFKHRV